MHASWLAATIFRACKQICLRVSHDVHKCPDRPCIIHLDQISGNGAVCAPPIMQVGERDREVTPWEVVVHVKRHIVSNRMSGGASTVVLPYMPCCTIHTFRRSRKDCRSDVCLPPRQIHRSKRPRGRTGIGSPCIDRNVAMSCTTVHRDFMVGSIELEDGVPLRMPLRPRLHRVECDRTAGRWPCTATPVPLHLGPRNLSQRCNPGPAISTTDTLR